MMTSKLRLRLAVCGTVLGAVYLGLTASAMAWNQPLWVRTFGSTRLDDGGIGIAADGKGNVYTAGTSRSVECGGECPDPQGWLAKLDASGALKWQRQIADGVTWARDVATDGAGSAYVAGWTRGALGGANLGGYDAWLAKYDAAGNRLWIMQFGTSANDLAYGVATDPAGNVYITGLTEGALGGTYRGGSDAWVAKYDGDGRALWKKQIGTTAFDYSHAVATDATGNVYIGGTTGGPLGGPRLGGNDAWVAKFNASGQVLWKKQIGTSSSEDATGLATDPGGNVFVTGSIMPVYPLRDGWVAKLSGAGDLLWQRQLGTPEDDRAVGAATDGKGNVYVSGYTNGSLGGPLVGGQNGWVAKYDPAGDQRWVRQFGRDIGDEFWEVASDRASSIYLSGWTYESNYGNFDAWVVKYSTGR